MGAMRFAFLLYLLAAVANAELFQVQPFEQVGGGLPSFHFFSGDSPLVAFRGLSSSTPEWLAWADHQTALLNHVVTTMLGVHPCSYETWVQEVVIEDEDEYAYGDNLALYSSEYSYDTLGRRFGPFVAGSLPIDEPVPRRQDTAIDTTPVLSQNDIPTSSSMLMMYDMDEDYALNNVDLVRYFAATNNNIALPRQLDAGLVDGLVVEEVGFWDSLRGVSAWGVMLFLVLVAACLLVWASFISSCFAMRDALAGGMSQFLTRAEPVEPSLLEPLCDHDYQQPCVIYRGHNPVYRGA